MRVGRAWLRAHGAGGGEELNKEGAAMESSRGMELESCG